MITIDSVRLKCCSEMPSCGTTPYSKNSTAVKCQVVGQPPTLRIAPQ